ncbi:phosphoadenosine phosphosulfate reductase [Hyaloraphidium curvatum]|nr:phosphoadenosine phosphosulfate reductase [Hyaloraphidium curvatum]
MVALSTSPSRASFLAGPPPHHGHHAPHPVHFSHEALAKLNERLVAQTPQQVLEWAILTFGDGLYQTTSFGATGSVILDMLAKISKRQVAAHHASASVSHADPASRHQHLVPLIFIDTLYHFPETVELAHRSAAHYNAPMHVFKPKGVETTEEFEREYGKRLWETDPESYDFLVKAEPGNRSYHSMQPAVQCAITGRRRSQRGDRSSIKILEYSASQGVYKLNPLATWTWDQVWAYLRDEGVPYNPLYDRSYRSIGDWHSTQPVKEGEDERAGRFVGQTDGDGQKTECGLHKDYFKMRAAFKQRERMLAKQAAEAAAPAAGSGKENASA